MKSYNKKGLYNSYDKKHKERDSLDYYSTPIKEVENILNILNLDLKNMIILEPTCGGGHMYRGIHNYIIQNPNNYPDAIIATDVIDRATDYQFPHDAGKEYDFLSDDYHLPIETHIDYIIMNPPYSTIEPFTIRALEIAERGVLMLGRLQFLEGKGRYENILKDNPPSDIYVYVDRIKCYKNGDLSDTSSSAQAYAWFYWDLTKKIDCPRLHWIRRVE